MYLHLGQSVVVPESAVVGIFDLDNTTGAHITRRFLNNAERDGRIVNVSGDIPKSFVVCNENDRTEIFLSQLSSQTLMKRSGLMRFD